MEKKRFPSKNKYGQYFTPEPMADFMIKLASIKKTSKILEPSSGEGVFLDLLLKNGYTNLSAYEIDPELKTPYSFVRNESFISANISEKYDLIIGNPPYIRWKNLEEPLKEELLNNPLWNKYFNSLCDYLYIFILKSIELLKENGQLIFICPEYWMTTTHSITLRNYMVKNGHFERIYHFNETPIFNKVAVSVIVFKFVKGKPSTEHIKVAKYYPKTKLSKTSYENLLTFAPLPDAEYIKIDHFSEGERWILLERRFHEKLKLLENSCITHDGLFSKYTKIEDVCEIGNGLVSGLDKAFRAPKVNLNEEERKNIILVSKAKDLEPFKSNQNTDYIFIKKEIDENTLRKVFPNFYTHLQGFKDDLGKRYKYNRDLKYWEWAFLRNFQLFQRKEKRILVPCKERISNKDYFRFALVDENTYSTQDVTAVFRKTETKESIEYILAFLNQPIVFEWLKHNGIVKGNIVEFSEQPLASIPFRKINWNEKSEVQIHSEISVLTQMYIEDQKTEYKQKIQKLFDYLIYNV